MKRIPTKTATLFLVVAGSVIPGFGQDRGGHNGWARADRPTQGQQGGQYRGSQESRPQVPTQQASQQDRRGSYGQSQYQQQRMDSRPQFQRPQQAESYSQPLYRQERSYREQPGVQQRHSYQERQGFQQQRYERQDGPQSTFREGRSFQHFSSRNWETDHRTWSQRGGYRGYYIPQTRFYTSFGRQNYFRIGQPDFYDGYPRFQYGGFGFRIMDRWPEYWGSDWYESDDVSVVYEDDGYYLYNRRYPSFGISIDIDFQR